jgi:CheY-like chemotaxis protein
MKAEQIEITNTKSHLPVEDDPQNVELMLAALRESSDHRSRSRGHRQTAAHLHRRGKCNNRTGGNLILVLMEIKMPKDGGLEVLKTIEADEPVKIIPVVVPSTSRETPDWVERYPHEVDAYEVKTVDFGELVAAVEKLGIFRAAINEPPPNIGRVESGHATVPENEDDHNGIPASYPASGG